MESGDFLAICTCIYSTSRERKRLFGCCFHPRPAFRVGKISQCACAFLDESPAWVWRKSLFYECTTCACNSPLLKPFYGGLRGRFPCFAPISYHSPQKPSNIRAIYQMAGNQELFLAHELLPFTRYVPDLARLSAHKDRIVLAVGHDTRELLAGELAYRPAAWLAERLGTQVVDFPGDHGGYGVHPAAFAAKLREVLG